MSSLTDHIAHDVLSVVIIRFICTALSLLLAAPQTIVVAPPDVPFEVASIKPNTSGSGSSSSNTPPGGSFLATNVTARQLIVNAYRLRQFQLVGGPDWIETLRFDVRARSPEDSARDQIGARLRALLAERFGLVVHTETREQPIYALVLARSDGKLGPQMKPSTLDCERPNPPQRGAAAAPPPPPQQGQFTCGTNTSTNNTSGTMRAGGRTLADIVGTFGSFVVNRMVVDRTGLTGTYDFELKWVPDNLRNTTPDATTPDGPSIFTAIQEQLGLKLEAQRGPVEFLVIDKISQPTPD